MTNHSRADRALLALALIAGLGTSTPMATAFNWQFLSDAPIAHFNEEDLARFRAVVRETLESGADGTTTTWENPKTRASGKVTVWDTGEVEGLTCRRVRIHNTARGRTSEETYRFCKQPDGPWKVVP